MVILFISGTGPAINSLNTTARSSEYQLCVLVFVWTCPSVSVGAHAFGGQRPTVSCSVALHIII